MANSRLTNTEAVPLHAEASGSGPPLLVLHGLYGWGGNWRRHARWLAEQWRVFMVDLRNHGHSPHHPIMTYPAMAADLAALMDREGIQEATMLGHSMGGKAAMCLALLAPERVRRLIVADIAPMAYHNDNGAIIEAMRGVDLNRIASRREAEAELAPSVPEARVRQFLSANLERREDGWHWRLPLETLFGAIATLEGWPTLPGQYTGPVLFVHGADSAYVAGEAPRAAIRGAFPEARIEAIPSAGHFLHVEQPEAFADVVAAFLASD